MEIFDFFKDYFLNLEYLKSVMGTLVNNKIPVLDLVTDEEHDDVNIYEEEIIDVEVPNEKVDSTPPVYNVEHAVVQEEASISPVRVPSINQSTGDPNDTVPTESMDASQDLAAVKMHVHHVPREGATVAAATAPIQPPLTILVSMVNATLDETLVDNTLASRDAPPEQHINPRVQHDLDLWQRKLKSIIKK
jgi:hypothetical protein